MSGGEYELGINLPTMSYMNAVQLRGIHTYRESDMIRVWGDGAVVWRDQSGLLSEAEQRSVSFSVASFHKKTPFLITLSSVASSLQVVAKRTQHQAIATLTRICALSLKTTAYGTSMVV